MKFEVIHPRPDTDLQPYDFRGGDALVVFAQAHNMVVRGHTLVWHNQVPPWVAKGAYSSPQLAEILHHHIATVMGRYSAKVYAWDVVNEAFNDDGTMRHTLWYDQPGIGAGPGTKYIEQAFRWAHAADPNAKLFYNDYDAEGINKKSDAIYAMASDFKKRGIPLDGIGFQTHITLKFDDPESLLLTSATCKGSPISVSISTSPNWISDSATQLLRHSPLKRSSTVRLPTSVCSNLNANCCKPGDSPTNIPGFPSFYKGQGWALPWDDAYRKKPAYAALLDALSK